MEPPAADPPPLRLSEHPDHAKLLAQVVLAGRVPCIIDVLLRQPYWRDSGGRGKVKSYKSLKEPGLCLVVTDRDTHLGELRPLDVVKQAAVRSRDRAQERERKKLRAQLESAQGSPTNLPPDPPDLAELFAVAVLQTDQGGKCSIRLLHHSRRKQIHLTMCRTVPPVIQLLIARSTQPFTSMATKVSVRRDMSDANLHYAMYPVYCTHTRYCRLGVSCVAFLAGQPDVADAKLA